MMPWSCIKIHYFRTFFNWSNYAFPSTTLKLIMVKEKVRTRRLGPIGPFANPNFRRVCIIKELTSSHLRRLSASRKSVVEPPFFYCGSPISYSKIELSRQVTQQSTVVCMSLIICRLLDNSHGTSEPLGIMSFVCLQLSNSLANLSAGSFPMTPLYSVHRDTIELDYLSQFLWSISAFLD